MDLTSEADHPNRRRREEENSSSQQYILPKCEDVFTKEIDELSKATSRMSNLEMKDKNLHVTLFLYIFSHR